MLLTAEQLKAAVQANRSAEADLRRAESVRSAGLSTDVDVLSIRVHLAAVEEQRIQRSADLDVAQAALNDILGIPLDTPHDLTSPLTRASVARCDPAWHPTRGQTQGGSRERVCGGWDVAFIL